MTTTTENPTYEQRETQENQQQAEAQLEGLAWLGQLTNWRTVTAFPDRLDERIEERAEREREGILSIEVERTLRIVLCTGGPHCEIRWPEGRDPNIVCYGWFGAGHYERPLTADEEAGLYALYGDWDSLAYLLQEPSDY